MLDNKCIYAVRRTDSVDGCDLKFSNGVCSLELDHQCELYTEEEEPEDKSEIPSVKVK